MKIVRLLGLVLLTGVFFSLFANDDGPPKYVKIKRPLPNIYVQLDPKSDILRQGKRGEYLEIITQGTTGSWYKVKVNIMADVKEGDEIKKQEVWREGWIEAKAGDIVNKKSNPAVLMFIIVITLMFGCAGCAILFVRKQQQAAAASD